MHHLVNLSGGLQSAVAANRVLSRFPTQDVTLWFADTSWEDEDLFRFLAELEAYWGKTVTRHQDGRQPLQVAAQKGMIPNAQNAPCSVELKAEPGERFRETLPKPLTQYFGFDWTDMGRVEKYQARYAALSDVAVDFPLLWTPIESRPYEAVVRSWGIEPPRLYRLGFPHNNCGGRCVRQGIAEWHRLLVTFPERFAEVEAWEQEQRAKGGARATFAICRDRTGGESHPVTLAEIRQRYEHAVLEQPSLIEDRNECFCIA